jgi:signal transduction histidine kinase
MKLNSIVIKLGGTFILLFLIVLLPSGFVIDQIFTGFYYNKTQEQIDQLSSRYADSIASTDNSMMAVNMIELMSEFSRILLYIVDDHGKVIANSGVPWVAIGSDVPSEEVNSIAGGKSLHKTVESPSTENRYLVSANPIIQGKNFIGAVYVLTSVEGIQQSLQKVRYLLVLSGFGALFLALGLTLVLSRKLSAPLILMEGATRQIAKGDLDIRVSVPSGDEIGSLAKAINELAVDLQRYRDTRCEFFANISHELRTPMTYLEGYAKVLKEGLYDSEEEKARYLDIIHQEAKRLTHLLHDLFELSKMEEGKISLNLEPVDLSEAAENTVQRIGLKAKEKGLDLHMDLPDQPQFIIADGLRIEQIFTNLLYNAIRYTEHGSVMVQIRNDGSNQVLAIIEDTGIGIPKQELPHIFERFYRVEKSRSREHGGTGLGLAIVKTLVEIQGGTIGVSSGLGKGTRFEIRFPREGGEEG